MIAAALLIPVLGVLGGLAVAGYPMAEVVASWVHGCLGSPARIAQTLQESSPLLLTGLATAIAFSSGVISIGAEGQYLIGAVTLVAMGTRFDLHRLGLGSWSLLIVALAVAAGAGAGWALLATLLQRWRQVPVVLSTLLLNFIALFLVSALVEGVLHDPTTSAPQTALIDQDIQLPTLLSTGTLHLGVILAVVIALGAWAFQRRSTIGFELQAIGLNPQAALMAGMPVTGRQALAMAISGALAGLAGALQVAGVTHFMTTTTSSYGYAGVAVAMLGRLHPLGVAGAAVFFGMLDTGGRHLERDLGVPHDLGDVLKGLVVLTALVATALPLSGWTRTRRVSVGAVPAPTSVADEKDRHG